MVSPRLAALKDLDDALARTENRASGLVQRARVLSLDNEYYPALVRVLLYLRRGETAVLDHVRLLGSFASLTRDQLEALLIGQDVLLLCPSGRAADLAIMAGLLSVPNSLLQNVGNNTTLASRTNARQSWESNILVTNVPAGTPTLTIRGVEVAIVESVRALPSVEISYAGVSATFTANTLIDTPKLFLDIPGVEARAVMLDGFLAVDVSGGAVLEMRSGIASSLGFWDAAFTGDPAQVPTRAVANAVFTPVPSAANPVPVMRLFGRFT